MELLRDIDSRYDHVLQRLSQLDDRVLDVLGRYPTSAGRDAAVAGPANSPPPPDLPHDRDVA
jgi:hypothetical protein